MRLEGSDSGRRTARRLRKEMTPPEVALWLVLRRTEGIRFRRQHASGAYVLDFYCAPARLAIEIDGRSHDLGDRPQRDAARDQWLATKGVRVLRYPAVEILSNLDGVVQEIMVIAQERRDTFALTLSTPSVGPG